MTSPNLTPAEALEFLKAIDAQQNVWDVMDRIKGSLGVGTLRQRIARVGIAGIEAALEKLAAYEAREPAAAVPSDEEIAKQIGYVMASQGDICEVHDALRMLAKRIGVKL